MRRYSITTVLSTSLLLILALFAVSIECSNYTNAVPVFGFMNEEVRDEAMIIYRQQNENSTDTGSSNDYSCGIAGKRKTLDGKTACKRFCGMDDNNDCHETDYILSITMGAVAGLVLAVLSILAFFVFLCGRCVCNCFGGRKASKGVCCGNVYDFEGYSTKQVWIMKILLILTFAGIVACAIVGYVANGKTNKGADTFFDTIINFAQTIIDKVTVIGDMLKELPYSSDIGDTITSATSQANSLVDDARGVRTTANDYNHYRYSALIASFAVPLFFVLLGIIAALFNIGALSMAAALFTFFCSFIIWISFGIHNLVSILLTDLCFEIDAYLDGTSGSEPNAAIQQLLKCANGGAFDDIRNQALNALQTAFNYTCQAAENVCDIPGTNCQADYANNCTRSTISAFVNTTITDFLIGCNLPGFDCPDESGACPDEEKTVCYSNTLTIQSCTENCNNTEIKDYANEIVYNLGVAIKYDVIIQDHILPLLDCAYVSEAFGTVKDSICVTVNDATENIYISSLILAILLIPATILMILGCKRFNKSNNEDMYDNDVEMRS